MSKKEEAFKVYAALQGFDIQGFDRWLPSLQGYGAFVELTERRQAALEAMLANDESTALRHMEWMLLQWRRIDRGDKTAAAKKRALVKASETGATRRSKDAAKNQKKADEWFSLAWAKDPNVGHTKLLENAKQCLKEAEEIAGIESIQYRKEGKTRLARDAGLKAVNLAKEDPMLSRRRAQAFLAKQKPDK